MPPCIESGYTILEQGDDGKYFPLYTLDAASNAMAVTFFEEATKEDGYKVITEGFACDDGTVTLSTIALAADDEGMDEDGMDEDMDEDVDEGMVDEGMDDEGEDTNPAYALLAGHGLAFLAALVNYLLF